MGNSPEGIAITPDGSYAYVTNYGSGTVSVIDTSTNAVIATVTVGTDPYGVALNGPPLTVTVGASALVGES